jgi:multisubunit Na+/H+ antiporter MnhB subunit
MVLVAAYLTWVGAYAPGGAFQGAAVLGAAGVLFLLMQKSFPRRLPARVSRWALPGLAGVGFAIFLGVALIGLATGGRLLEYPSGLTGPLILSIEVMLTLSIAVILVALFPGGPHPDPSSATSPVPEKEAP